MKHFTLLILATLYFNLVYAQDIPNYSFENWNDISGWSDPQPFNSFNQMSWTYFQQPGVVQSN
ncbi:MAG: hypothetical protein K1X54_14755, partial [Flavobacteriales bacterium]|nr:hypothetical protein [Flavobacteriales bacterium]